MATGQEPRQLARFGEVRLLEVDPNRVDINIPGSLLRLVSLETPIEDGVVYRLKMTVKEVKGLPMRYADVTLQVARADEPGKIIATGGVRFNLSNDNMPDLGQAGLYFYGGIYPSETEPSGIFANNISVKSLDETKP